MKNAEEEKARAGAGAPPQAIAKPVGKTKAQPKPKLDLSLADEKHKLNLQQDLYVIKKTGAAGGLGLGVPAAKKQTYGSRLAGERESKTVKVYAQGGKVKVYSKNNSKGWKSTAGKSAASPSPQKSAPQKSELEPELLD